MTKCLHCDRGLEQSGRGRPRKFCDPNCRDAYYNALKPRKETVEYHMLSNIDIDTRTADCSACEGRVKIWRGGSRRQRWRCANRVRAQVSRARITDPQKERVRKMVSNGVKITLEQFVELESQAAGRCQLCGRECDLHLDPCHDTGRVRGLLCSTCNTGLGKFGDDSQRLLDGVLYLLRDDPAKLRAAADYLEAAQAKTGV